MTAAPPLGPDLGALVRARAAPLLAARRISTHGAARPARDTFRLDFADGVTVKGRQLASASDARRVEAVVARLDPERFPRVLARRGKALLEAWIPGESLDRLPPEDRHILWAAETLAAVHRVAPGRRPTGAGWVRARRAALSRELRRLAAAGALPEEAARDLRELALAHAPRTTELTIVHRDLCPENIVLDRDGRLFSIDNAMARAGAPDEDLARTCYRWPLGPRERGAFLDAYRAFRDPRGFLDHLPFWMVAALAHAAWVRRLRGYAKADVPLRRLLGQLDGADGPIACSASSTTRW
jgi:Ser/Thr protein kinase RdoA (MazF antagonist)